MNTLIDTHCHITCDALYERIDEVLENARQAGIEKMLIICTDFTEYERAQQLKEREPERFDIALGFHPNDLYAFQEADYERLEELLKQERIIAVGEIGLDYHWDDVKPQDQKTGFIRQIRLAQKYNKPILIHMREATKDTLDILKDMGPLKGIMHCYSGSKEVAMELIKIGFYISFGVSYNKIFAKIGSDMDKHKGLVEITRENYRERIWPLPVQDLFYVGRAT